MIVILDNSRQYEMMDYKTKLDADLVLGFFRGKCFVYKNRYGLDKETTTFREGIALLERAMLHEKK